MSLLRHVKICNEYQPDRFVPFWHGTDRLGLMRKNNAEALRRFPKEFAVGSDGVRFLAQGSFDELSKIIDDVTEQLVSDGLVAKWRYEYFVVAPRWGATPHFKLDRGAVPFFGVRAYGVHLNGLRRDSRLLHTSRHGAHLFELEARSVKKYHSTHVTHPGANRPPTNTTNY